MGAPKPVADPEKPDPVTTKLKKAILDEKIRKAAKEHVREEESKGIELIYTPASKVKLDRPERYFGGRLLRSSFQLLIGPGESGKGMVSTDLLSCLSNGTAFPGEEEGRDPMKVIVCVTEDSKGVIKSRLIAAGADEDNVIFAEGPVTLRGGLSVPSPLAFEDDAGRLAEDALKMGAGAIWLETTLEHLGSRDMNASQFSTNNEFDVRRALSPILAVCEHSKLIGWGVIHPRKSTEGGLEDSISGSAAFRNVPRGILHVYRDPEDKSDNPRRLLCCSKANYLRQHPSTLRFRIDTWEGDPDEGHVVWGISGRNLEDPRNARDIYEQIKEARTSRSRRDFAVQEAEQFLMRWLEGGPVFKKKLQEEAETEGISSASLRRAAINLKVAKKKEKAFPATGDSLWSLPEGEDGEEEESKY